MYCALLSVVNIVQGCASFLLYETIPGSLCILDFTMFVYYTLFGPLVYWTFLKDFFRSSTDFHVLTVGNDHTAYVYSHLPTEDHLSSDEYD